MKARRFFYYSAILVSLTLCALDAKADILDFIPAIVAASTPALPPCAGQIPEEPAANGDYRSSVFPIQTDYSNPQVAVARNGWRSLVISDDGLDVFGRDGNSALAHIPVNEPYTAAFSLAHDGSAFVIGDTNLLGSVRLRYFECGAGAPAWTWESHGGSWPKVALDAEG